MKARIYDPDDEQYPYAWVDPTTVSFRWDREPTGEWQSVELILAALAKDAEEDWGTTIAVALPSTVVEFDNGTSMPVAMLV